MRVLGGFAALRFAYTDQLRSTFMASFQEVDYSKGLIPLDANDSAYSFAGNLFYSP